MSKHKNRFTATVAERDLSTKAAVSNTQGQLPSENQVVSGVTKNKTSGLWVIFLFFGLMFLVFLLGWLTTR